MRQKRRQLKRSWRIGLIALAAIIAAAAIGTAAWFWAIRPWMVQARTAHTPGAKVTVPEWVTQDLLPINEYSRPGTPLEEINGVVIHYVGNPGTSAKNNRNYFANLSITHTTSASSHFIVGLEGEVIQCVPLSEISYASNQRNVDTVAIEVCHPDETGEFNPETMASLVKLTAWLCDTFDLETDQVIRHYDVSGKECPRYYVQHPEAWEQLKADVEAAREK